MQTFTIPGRLEGLNNLILADRTNRFMGAKVKRSNTDLCAWAIRAAKLQKVERYPVTIWIRWTEPNGRRDPDNVASAKKYVLDGLQTAGIIENDGAKQIRGFVDSFEIDSRNPHVTVEIYEAGEPLAVPQAPQKLE